MAEVWDSESEGDRGKQQKPQLSCFVSTEQDEYSEDISYLEGSTDTAFDVCSGRQYVGVVRDVFRDLIRDWSQEMTEQLRGDNKQ